MKRRNATKLGWVLDAADVPGAVEGTPSGWCGLCDCTLTAEDGIVEVELRSTGDGGTDAWLCHSCYEYVVGEMGIAPTRVFKAGPHRTVVFPIGPEEGREPVAGSD